MTGYPKIWTSLLFKDWFVQLRLPEKGLYLWLILEAKNQGDTGTIICRNLSEFSSRIGVYRSTLSKLLDKLHQLGKITISKNEAGPIVIGLPNYRKYQELKAANPVCQKISTDFSTSHINQTRPDNNHAAGAFKKSKWICKQCGKPATAFIDGVCLKCKGF